MIASSLSTKERAWSRNSISVFSHLLPGVVGSLLIAGHLARFGDRNVMTPGHFPNHKQHGIPHAHVDPS